MKILFLSDTHSQHEAFEIPAADMVVHAGDFSKRGGETETRDFLNWYAHLPAKHKILIAGNHDFVAETHPELFNSWIPEGVTYLNDSGCEVEGIKIWGSPIQPWFHDWAFNRLRGEQIKKHWDLIPEETDLLITHGPPQGMLDRTFSGNEAGCFDLMERVKKIEPQVHVFGHIHEAYGAREMGKTLFINASNLDLQYLPVHPPLLLDWQSKEFLPVK